MYGHRFPVILLSETTRFWEGWPGFTSILLLNNSKDPPYYGGQNRITIWDSLICVIITEWTNDLSCLSFDEIHMPWKPSIFRLETQIAAEDPTNKSDSGLIFLSIMLKNDKDNCRNSWGNSTNYTKKALGSCISPKAINHTNWWTSVQVSPLG